MQRQMDVLDLSGWRVASERLHVTLHLLGDYAEVPEELLRRAMDAGSSVEMAPFGVGFDRIGSLGGPEIGGLALTGGAELRTLRQFQRVVTAAMEAQELGQFVRKRFNPHVSLLYGDHHVAPEPIAPIRWRVDELVLIDSHVGLGKHVVLAVWPLQSRQMSFDNW